MSIVSDIIIAHLPGKRKTTPSGWTSFNAPCCHHNGDAMDKRGRGGLISEGDTVSYHCFNCGYKASWQPGRAVSQKLRKLLQWLGCNDDTITKLTFDVMRINEGVQVAERNIEVPTFETTTLPADAVKITDIKEFNKFSMAVLEYMAVRNLNLDDTTYYWSPSLAYRDRLIIPFYYENRIVGSTARTITADKKPKYLNDQQAGFVYGLDNQTYDKEFAILVEGPMDAIHIQGMALGGSEINDAQALLINKLGKDIVVVPDRDQAGKKLVEDAIGRGWGVSMPEWDQDINDVGDCVDKYGRLYALYSIASAAETSPLKIRLRAKKWFV
jgi:hypothetical protein